MGRWPWVSWVSDRSVALRLPNVTSFSLGRSVNAEHGLKHLPSDAVKHFRQAMPKALEVSCEPRAFW